MRSNNLMKWFLSFLMWGGVIAVTIESLHAVQGNPGPFPSDPVPVDAVIPLVVLAIIGALVGTFVLWVIPEILKLYGSRSGQITAPEHEKAKRGSQRKEQLALLMDLMDDDELAVFKDTLRRRVLDDVGYDDGELPYSGETLASLLDEEGTEKRLRQ